jgi:hypothetical protein
VTEYLAKGGNLLVSGAHIASDMQSKEDKAFIKEQLHYTYRCNHASEQGSLVVNRRVLLPGTYTFHATPNTECIHTENPDCILPTEGAQAVAKYADTQLNAAVAYDGTDNQRGKTLAWGFMLESTLDFRSLYKESIDWLMR